MPGTHKCDQCDVKPYETSSTLWEHVYTTHEGGRFQCPHEPCPAKYTTTAKLRLHVRRVHGQANIFFCPWVGCNTRGTDRRDNIQRHSLTCSKRHPGFADVEKSKMPKAIPMDATAETDGTLERAREETVRASLAELDVAVAPSVAVAGRKSPLTPPDTSSEDGNRGLQTQQEGQQTPMVDVMGTVVTPQQLQQQNSEQDLTNGAPTLLEDPAVQAQFFEQEGFGYGAGVFPPDQAQQQFGGLDLVNGGYPPAAFQNVPEQFTPTGDFVMPGDNILNQQAFPQPATLPFQENMYFPGTHEAGLLHQEQIQSGVAGDMYLPMMPLGVSNLNGTEVNGADGAMDFTGVDDFAGVNGASGVNDFTGANGFSEVNDFTGANDFGGVNGFTGINDFGGVNGFTGVDGFNGFNGFNDFNYSQ